MLVQARWRAARRAWKVSHFSRIVMRLGELRATLWYTCGSSSSVSTWARRRRMTTALASDLASASSSRHVAEGVHARTASAA